MTPLSVTFSQPPVSFHSRHANIEIDVVAGAMSAQQQVAEECNLVRELVAQVTREITELKNQIADQRQLVRSTAAQYAIEIMQSVLQNDSELAETRLQAYLDAAFDGEDAVVGAGPAMLLVHPSMVPVAQKWMKESGPSDSDQSGIEIEADNGLLPGDCRFEIGDAGFYASLDAQLKMIRGRIAAGVPTVAEGASV